MQEDAPQGFSPARCASSLRACIGLLLVRIPAWASARQSADIGAISASSKRSVLKHGRGRTHRHRLNLPAPPATGIGCRRPGRARLPPLPGTLQAIPAHPSMNPAFEPRPDDG